MTQEPTLSLLSIDHSLTSRASQDFQFTTMTPSTVTHPTLYPNMGTDYFEISYHWFLFSVVKPVQEKITTYSFINMLSDSVGSMNMYRIQTQFMPTSLATATHSCPLQVPPAPFLVPFSTANPL